jgi:hypothetical protein
MKPSVWKLLLGSRKNIIGMLTALATIAVMIAGKYGLNWSVDAIVTAWSPVVLLAMSVIFGIAYEDGQQKAAGAGTTTTHEISKAGGTTAEVTTVKADPSGKP